MNLRIKNNNKNSQITLLTQVHKELLIYIGLPYISSTKGATSSLQFKFVNQTLKSM